MTTVTATAMSSLPSTLNGDRYRTHNPVDGLLFCESLLSVVPLLTEAALFTASSLFLQIKVNRSKGVSDLSDIDSSLKYSKDDLKLSNNAVEYNPCSWNGNWLLNVVASEDCQSDSLEEDECDVSKDLYRTLNSMSRRKDTFSVMGFVSKFFKVCKRLDKRRVLIKKRSSTQAPKRVSSEEGFDESAHHSYSVRNTNPMDLSRTLIDFGVGDDAEMLPAETTSAPPSTTTTKYVAISTTSAPTTSRHASPTQSQSGGSDENIVNIVTVPPEFLRGAPNASPTRSPPISSPSHSTTSSSSSSYVDRYLNQMDQLRNPAMVRYRLGIMFKDLQAADKERPRTTSVSTPDSR